MAGLIDFKFSGGILGTTGLPARGLLEMCMIHFKWVGFSMTLTSLSQETDVVSLHGLCDVKSYMLAEMSRNNFAP